MLRLTSLGSARPTCWWVNRVLPAVGRWQGVEPSVRPRLRKRARQEAVKRQPRTASIVLGNRGDRRLARDGCLMVSTLTIAHHKTTVVLHDPKDYGNNRSYTDCLMDADVKHGSAHGALDPRAVHRPRISVHALGAFANHADVDLRIVCRRQGGETLGFRRSAASREHAFRVRRKP